MIPVLISIPALELDPSKINVPLTVRVVPPAIVTVSLLALLKNVAFGIVCEPVMVMVPGEKSTTPVVAVTEPEV